MQSLLKTLYTKTFVHTRQQMDQSSSCNCILQLHLSALTVVMAFCRLLARSFFCHSGRTVGLVYLIALGHERKEDLRGYLTTAIKNQTLQRFFLVCGVACHGFKSGSEDRICITLRFPLPQGWTDTCRVHAATPITDNPRHAKQMHSFCRFPYIMSFPLTKHTQLCIWRQ